MAQFNKAAAGAALGVLWPGMLMRLLSLIASIASVVGVLTFFFFDGLVPYRWWLIVGGGLGAFVFGLIGDRFTPTREDMREIDVDALVHGDLAEGLHGNDGEQH